MLRDTTTIITSISDDGILYYFDPSRSKILSASRFKFGFSLRNKGIFISRYLGIAGGHISTQAGYLISKPSTIVSISARTKNNVNCIFNILKDGVSVGSITLSNENEKIDNSMNIDLSQGDFIQIVAMPTSGSIDYPCLTLETSIRKS